MAKLRIDNEKYLIYDCKVGKLVLSVTYLKPRQSTVGHQHDWPEIYYIASGEGKLELDQKFTKASLGKFIVIPPNSFHRLHNKSRIFPLVIVCTWNE